MTPHGDCFRTAYNEVVDAASAGLDESTTLVHGMITRPWTDEPIDHAWVEIENAPLVLVHDEVGDLLMPRDGYYELLKVDASTTRRYDAERAIINAVTTRHFGPWD